MSPEHAPVIALAANGDGGGPFVAMEVCNDGQCRLQRRDLSPLSAGDELLLTASGRWVVGIHENAVTSFDLRPTGEAQPQGGDAAPDSVTQIDTEFLPRNLVASMRGTEDRDWVIGRDVDGQLVRYAPGARTGTPLGANVPDLGVASIGERYLVGRQVHSAGEETLYLVDVAGEGVTNEHEAIALVRGDRFSKVTLTPRDDMLIATSGVGEDAETFVFDVASQTLLDRFQGAQISGRDGADDLPGLRAVSPDGSAIAYQTPGGTLALRGTDTQASCVVRSATHSRHAVAGFSADGILYLETDEGPGRSHVFAFDPTRRRLTALGDPQQAMKLVAVPGREVRAGGEETGEPLGHWALGASKGSYWAMMENAEAQALAGVDEIAVLARDDTAIWLVDKTKATPDPDAPYSTSNRRALHVRRLDARPRSDAPRTLALADADNRPMLYDAAGVAAPFEVTLETQQQAVCLTTGAPGSWAFGCGSTTESILFEMSPGDREQKADPGAAPAPQPQVDDSDD